MKFLLESVPYTAHVRFRRDRCKVDTEVGNRLKLYLRITFFSLGYGTLREEKTSQIHVSHSHQLGSNPSIYSGGGHGSQHSTGSIDQVTSPTVQNSNRPVNTGEDLYSWMAKQQEFIKDSDKGNLKGNWVRKTVITFFPP